jgi:hypothetical protein
LNPNPQIVISSESLGIPGDEVDFVKDLGIEQTRFKQLKVVLRPATKHKLRFEYTPVKYDALATVTRTFRFNGQRYDIGVPVTTVVDWKAYRFGYEGISSAGIASFADCSIEVHRRQASLTATLGPFSAPSSPTQRRRFRRSASSAAATSYRTSRSPVRFSLFKIPKASTRTTRANTTISIYAGP